MDLEKFAKIVVSKRIDIDDVIHSCDYEEYFDLIGEFVLAGAVDASNVLEEDEFAICKEVTVFYGNN